MLKVGLRKPSQDTFFEFRTWAISPAAILFRKHKFYFICQLFVNNEGIRSFPIS